MSDRIASDHPSIETIRVTVARHGGGRRLEVPRDISSETDTPPTCFLADRRRYARIETPPTSAGSWIVGIYPSPELARTGHSRRDELPEWLDDVDIAIGNSALLDEIEPTQTYGLREPGSRAVYPTATQPDSNLAEIARNLESSGDRSV